MQNTHDQLTAAAGDIAEKICLIDRPDHAEISEAISTNPKLLAMATLASEKEQEMLRLKAVETILDEDNWQEFASKVEQCPSVQSAIRVRKELEEAKTCLAEAQQWIDSEPDWKDKYMANYQKLTARIAELEKAGEKLAKQLNIAKHNATELTFDNSKEALRDWQALNPTTKP